MTNVFIVCDRATGEHLATLPLTVPIGATVEAFGKSGRAVGWTWADNLSNGMTRNQWALIEGRLP